MIINARKPKAADPLRRDPSRTLMIRQAFVADLNRRFNKLARAVEKFLIEDDELGLKPRRLVTDPFKANVQRYAFETDDKKVDAFKAWFAAQVEQGLLEVVTTGLTPAQAARVVAEPWTAKYVRSSYRSALVRAHIEVRKEVLSKAAEFTAGTQAQFLAKAFDSPDAVAKLRKIQTRAFDQLKGVTADMDRRISRSLGESLSKGYGARKAAQQLKKDVVEFGRERAKMVARTEIIHAHAEGQLDGYEELGVEEVGLQAEWLTAVGACPKCAAKSGEILTLAEARGLIPFHPNCRCTWAPYMAAFDGGKAKAKSDAKRQGPPKPPGSGTINPPDSGPKLATEPPTTPPKPVERTPKPGERPKDVKSIDAKLWRLRKKLPDTDPRIQELIRQRTELRTATKPAPAPVPKPKPLPVPKPAPAPAPKLDTGPVKDVVKDIAPRTSESVWKEIQTSITAKGLDHPDTQALIRERLALKRAETKAKAAATRAARKEARKIAPPQSVPKPPVEPAPVPKATDPTKPVEVPAEWNGIKDHMRTRHGLVMRAEGEKGFNFKPDAKVHEAAIEYAKAAEHMRSNFKAVRDHMESGLHEQLVLHPKKMIKSRGANGKEVDAHGFYRRMRVGQSDPLNSIQIAAHRPTKGKLNVGKRNWTVSDSSVSTFRHEYGHRIWHQQLNAAQRTRWQQVYDKSYQTLAKAKFGQPGWANSKVSVYGLTNASELWAESFAAYTHPDYVRGMLPADVESLLDEFLGG